MNVKIILVALVTAGLGSCSTAYKMQQTPDDVYYSPTPQRDEYVQVKNEEDNTVYNNEDRNVYGSPSWEDREILRRVNNRRWRKRSYDYGYDYPYGYGNYQYGYGTYPYGSIYPVYVDPKTSSPSTYKAPRKYNLGTYTKPPVTTYTIDAKTGKIKNAPLGPASTTAKPQTNNGSAVGNIIRRVFSNPNGSDTYNNSNNTSTQSRSFEPSRNSSSSSSSVRSSSSSSSSSSNAPVRSFKKN